MSILAILLSSTLSISANSGSNNIGDLYGRVMQLEEQNRRLQGRTEELEHQLEQLKPQPSSVTIQAQPVEKPVAPDSPSTPTPPTKPKVEIIKDEGKIAEGDDESANPADEFDQAFALMADGKTPEAKKQFLAFAKKYPSTDLAAEAYFWLGEMAFDADDYNAAAVNYLKGYKESPKSAKAPENVLKLSQTLRQLSKNEEACKNLGRFNIEFKEAPANLKQQANSLKNELKCS